MTIRLDQTLPVESVGIRFFAFKYDLEKILQLIPAELHDSIMLPVDSDQPMDSDQLIEYIKQNRGAVLFHIGGAELFKKRHNVRVRPEHSPTFYETVYVVEQKHNDRWEFVASYTDLKAATNHLQQLTKDGV